MAVITKSSTTTLQSSTAEGLLLELLTFLRTAEINNNFNPNNKKNIQLNYDLNNFTVNSSFSLSANQSINESGQIITTASEYLINTGFTSSGDGTFKSTGLSQLLHEIITYAQIPEKNISKNPQELNNISASFDSDENIFSGTISIPITVNFTSNGHPEIIAKEYLLS